MDYNGLLMAVGLPLARSVGGWFVNALSDGKIEKFEIKKLVETIVRVGWIPALAWFGFDYFSGIDVAVWVALGMTATDWLMSQAKKLRS